MSSAAALWFGLPQVAVREVLAVSYDAHIADLVAAFITKTRHHVSAFAAASLGKLAALFPDRTPLIEGQKKRDATSLGMLLLLRVSNAWVAGIPSGWVSRIQRAALGIVFVFVLLIPSSSFRGGGRISASRSVQPVFVRLLPRLLVGPNLFGCSWHSLRSSQPGSWVRGGVGLPTGAVPTLHHPPTGVYNHG